MEHTILTCKNCDHSFFGEYCNSCGEKVYNETDKKMTHFLGEAFHFSTHLEGKFFTTIKTIFTAPGKLSLDYCNGIRKKYFKPLSLFLLIIILYLLFPLAKGLNMRFNTYVSAEYNYTWYAKPIIKNKIIKTNISLDELAIKYDAKSQKFAKPFLLLILPLTGLVLYFLFYKKRQFFFDHFVLAIELSSTIFAIMFLLFPLLKLISTAIYPASEALFKDGGVFNFIAFAVLLMMVILAIKRFYGQNWLWTFFKSTAFLVLFALLIINIIYNFVLFVTVNLFI
jgi:Protein of unknown function (DUF3667)